MVLSPMWERGGCPAPLPNEDSVALSRIYAATHMTLQEIRKCENITLAQLSQRTLIPVNTLKKWETGVHPCPLYVGLHILNACNMLPICCDNYVAPEKKRKAQKKHED